MHVGTFCLAYPQLLLAEDVGRRHKTLSDVKEDTDCTLRS
jgi:hypothetical protein